MYIVGWLGSDWVTNINPTHSDQPKDLGWVELGQFRWVDGFDAHP